MIGMAGRYAMQANINDKLNSSTASGVSNPMSHFNNSMYSGNPTMSPQQFQNMYSDANNPHSSHNNHNNNGNNSGNHMGHNNNDKNNSNNNNNNNNNQNSHNSHNNQSMNVNNNGNNNGINGSNMINGNDSFGLIDDFDMQLPEIHYLILKIIYWDNVLLTGCIMTTMILLWILSVLQNYSVLTLLSIISVFVLSTSMIYVNCLYFYTDKTTTNLPPNFKMPNANDNWVSERTWLYFVTHFRLFINWFAYHITYIITCQSNLRSIIFLIVSICCAFIGACFDGITILFITFITALTLPKLIQIYWDPIIDYINKNNENINDINEMPTKFVWAVIVAIFNIIKTNIWQEKDKISNKRHDSQDGNESNESNDELSRNGQSGSPKLKKTQ